MIELPDFDKAFEYENYFYLSCNNTRIAKLVAQYELFKLSLKAEGDIVECGVFKGASLIRFAHFREIFNLTDKKRIFGFDTFGYFPQPKFERDNELYKSFVASAGAESISKEQLNEVLKKKGIDEQVYLIEGDIRVTVPEFLRKNPDLKISLLNLDVDLYEPSVIILEYLYPRLSMGGILLLDDYGKFPGESKAVDEYFSGKEVQIRKMPFSQWPYYIVKE